ncbi:GNAT family N-acetyltransferase [Psychrobacillus sp. NEAU-3TGS]|uniref:GNAT family N-acetyltransferase n=1 Tax=Psychrobacillus sp. NEAU-3TGS TaxID=2995412 RepID=UPI0024962F20|nr:GNAT family N-acetyltransferase [Psychrobacillus sp. NEAU-3TGS]MDI2587042.1 GNAT family N-acetyltransferase [Psychrobacillus sp. NEAU-3TGS]
MKKIREATKEDMINIYMMGFDVWGDDMPVEEYITMCQDSIKYKKGKWYVLEATDTKELLSSLIVYKLNPSEDLIVKGIGSIATPANSRKNGYAFLLVKETINKLEQEENCNNFFLYSNIGTDFYKRLGFIVLPNESQKYKDSICMYYSNENDIDSISFDIPNYF